MRGRLRAGGEENPGFRAGPGTAGQGGQGSGKCGGGLDSGSGAGLEAARQTFGLKERGPAEEIRRKKLLFGSFGFFSYESEIPVSSL